MVLSWELSQANLGAIRGAVRLLHRPVLEGERNPLPSQPIAPSQIIAYQRGSGGGWEVTRDAAPPWLGWARSSSPSPPQSYSPAVNEMSRARKSQAVSP